MKIWLDDDRPEPEGWVCALNAKAAIGLMRSMKADNILHMLTHMSFDHDLADVHYQAHWAELALPDGNAERLAAEAAAAASKEMTGYDVLLWMIENEVWPTEACYVHTHNSVRGPVMADMINRYGPYDHRIKWSPYRPSVEEVRSLMIESQRYVLGDDLPGSY